VDVCGCTKTGATLAPQNTSLFDPSIFLDMAWDGTICQVHVPRILSAAVTNYNDIRPSPTTGIPTSIGIRARVFTENYRTPFGSTDIRIARDEEICGCVAMVGSAIEDAVVQDTPNIGLKPT
jgi:hypothetical protein